MTQGGHDIAFTYGLRLPYKSTAQVWGDEHPVSKVRWWRKDSRLSKLYKYLLVYGLEIQAL